MAKSDNSNCFRCLAGSFITIVKANQRMKVIENYIWFPVVHENSLVLKFEIPALEFFSVVNMQFQNRELSKLTLAGPQ